MSSDEDTLADEGTDAPRRELEPGDRVARFVIRRRVGSGGMGVVYAAHDPELERNVALKLLRPSLHGQVGTDGQQRLLREARAMARLAHPNVIAIHDVGIHDGQVYLAMELVEGESLRAWLREGPHPWRECVRMLTMAGRGLAAAHDKGLVHRDFKPENVMVDLDGRARVMDFGLVRSISSPAVERDEATSRSDDEAATIDLTQAGKAMGTPAYMAPEQHVGKTTDARTDQFAWCVVLFEALHGARPFLGDTPAALMFSVVEGEIGTPEARGVPGWLRRVVRRGLAVDPARRFADMHTLLAEIDRGQVRARLYRVLVVVAILAAIGGAIWARGVWLHEGAIAACERAGEEIAEVWPGRASTLRQGLVASDVPDAEGTADRLSPWLDRWAEDWQSTRTQTCRAATVERTMPADLAARIGACLDVERLATDATLETLESADASLAEKAVTVVAQLEPPTFCADEARLGRIAWPDATDLERVTQLRGVLGRSHVFVLAGRADAALEEVERVKADVDALGWPPLVAETKVRIADATQGLGRMDEAEALYRDAYYAAGSAGADFTAVEAATHLTHIVGVELVRPREGFEWAEQARMHLARVGAEDGLEASALANAIAGIHFVKGELDEARVQLERAVAIQERMLGPEHPELAAPIHNLGGLARAAGRYDEAQGHFQRAIDIRLRALGPTHPGLAGSYASLAAVQLARGDTDTAEALLRKSLAIVDARLPKDHPSRASVLNSLAAVLRAKKQYRDAEPLYLEAIGIFERTDHPDLGSVLQNLGNLYTSEGDYARATPLHERALALLEKAYGPDHPYVANALTALGDARRGEGRLPEAIAALERSLAIREARETPHEDLGETRFLLARALWDAGGDRPRARSLARLAAEDFAAHGEGTAEERTEVETWLETTEP